MSNKKILDIIETIIIIILIIFGLFIFYQIILKIFGGSWSNENLIIALLMLNMGVTITLAVNQVKLHSDHNHLTGQFKSLANDFKSHLQYK